MVGGGLQRDAFVALLHRDRTCCQKQRPVPMRFELAAWSTPCSAVPSMTSSLFGSRRSREPRVHVVRPGFRAVGFWISCGAERALDVLCDFYRNFYRTPSTRDCTAMHAVTRASPRTPYSGALWHMRMHAVARCQFGS